MGKHEHNHVMFPKKHLFECLSFKNKLFQG